MAKPLVEWGDAERAVIDYYGSAYTGTIASRAPGTVSTSPPQTPLTGNTWHMQVELDGSNTDDWPVERATIRVTCHRPAGQRSNVKADAALAFGLLNMHPGDANLFYTVPMVGRSSVIVDPDTKNLMVWFTFRVNMRPIQLTV